MPPFRAFEKISLHVPGSAGGWKDLDSDDLERAAALAADHDELAVFYDGSQTALGGNMLPSSKLILDFKLGITNLTSTQRDQVATDADFILEGRTVYAGVNYKL